MLNFEFYNPTKIIFGKDRFEELDKNIDANAKVMITYGGGSVNKFGTLDRVVKALGNREIVLFGGIEPNPRYETLKKAIAITKSEKVDFLLAVGGGSVIDGTKFISMGSLYDGNCDDLLQYGGGDDVPVENVLPIATVLTLPATGSEMNCGCVVSGPNGKLAYFSEKVFPKFSILDPTLTYTLPETQVANGIVDTFIHTVEQYVTYIANGNFQDRTAEGILQTLIEIGKFTIENPTDYDSRANLVWCSTMALNGLIGAGVPGDWSCHMIGHELTNLFGIDHGKTLAILQPAIWSVMRKQKHAKLLQYGKRVWGICDNSEEKCIDLAINKTREFFNSLGIKTKLSEYGIKPEQLELVIEALKLHKFTALSETGEITPDKVREILQLAL